MKHIIFNMDNLYFRLASTDAKKESWLNSDPNATAVQVTDQEFFDAATQQKIPTLSNGSIVWTDTSTINDMSASAEDKTTAIQNAISDWVKSIKKVCGDRYSSMSDAQSVVSFLEAVDTSVHGWTENQTYANYVYSLSNCPQVFADDIELDHNLPSN